VPAKGRVEVQCPHCGNIQLEPELAKSTYCRKCSGYIQISKGGRTGGPRQDVQKAPSVLQKIEGLLGVQRTVVARCFECPGKREVPKSATSTICPLCGAYIDLQDYKIVGTYSRSIRTRGNVLITPKGDLNSNRAICESALVQGHMRGALTGATDILIKLKGKLSGSIEAPLVIIDKKSEVECVRPIRADLVEVYGIISARIISNGKVVVKRGGSLRGAVNARSFIVDKGGEFYGDLSIGQTQLTQGELLNPLSENSRPDKGSGHGPDFSLAPA
jgi:cytoskeletal protein CcmA (bactofilin family)/Zn finger protein HypA/HybF involved in hydrogenase expression